MRNLLLLLVVALFGTACRSSKPRVARGNAIVLDTANLPQQPVDAVFKGASRVDFWQSETLTWRMRTSSLRQDPVSQKVWSKPVDLTAYGKKGDIVARIQADSGTMDRGMRFFYAWGHVVGGNHGGMELRTDSIIFDKESDRIFTSARVRVKTEVGDVLTGRGFRSDAYLNRWEILSDIKGQFHDMNALPFGSAI